jgi:hypothetical protein
VAFDADLCAPFFFSVLSGIKRFRAQAGSTFFDGWDFWDTSDPTHGVVDYVSQTDGVRSSSLHSVLSAY